MEFSSTYTKNIHIVNNIFSGKGKFKSYQKELTLDEFVKKHSLKK